MPKPTSDELRQIIRKEYADKRLLGALISGIKVHSKTKVSQWLNRKYPADTAALERDIINFLKRNQLSRADERRLTDIHYILNSADNRDAIIAEIAASA